MMGNQWDWGLFLSLLLVVTKYTCLAAQNSTVSCHEQERQALLKFKHSVEDDFNMLSSWVGSDCCSWKGVSCATEMVVSLNLRGNYMMGVDFEDRYYLASAKVMTHLKELRHLKHLDLSGNDFFGSRIPDFIGSLKQLSYLNLSHSEFGGIIPHQIGNLSNLKVLDLSSLYSDLNANDMAWVCGLSSLKHLDLGGLDISQAKNIDKVFYMIPSLIFLSLRDSQLSNAHLGLHRNSSKILHNIEHLDLSSNSFEGHLPHLFQNVTSLDFLDLSKNNLSVAWNSINLINMIPSLSELHLSTCALQNAHFYPTNFNFSAHSNIRHLDLSDNSIDGRFPSKLENMTSLRVLELSNNRLNSSIPVMPNLLKLDVSLNNIDNIELVGIWRQCHLKELSISRNNFEGEIIGSSTNTSECSQYALEMLDSSFSQLNGSIPESFGKLTNLRFLHLSSNMLTGSIPKGFQRLTSLEVLDLSGNNLRGPIPTFVGKLTKLDLYENQLSGSIPESLGRLSSLTDLNLGSNRLTGPIPASLGRLALLERFDVFSNLLNGTIPISMGQLSKLAILDVSYNFFEGMVSEAHFANLSSLQDLNTTSNHKLTFNISHDWIPPFQLRIVDLGSCKIANGFPQWLQTQKRLYVLWLSNTSLHGDLPTWLQMMPVISTLDLSHNQLGGSLINLPIGNPIRGFDVSKALILKDNVFNGSIPRSMCKTTNLFLLDVSNNRLSGNIPDCLQNLQHMVFLSLSSNRLSGVLPSSLGNISSSLQWLKLSDNNFSGELPRNLWNLRFLRVLDLSNNKFSGKIPKLIGKKLSNLRLLTLHKNNFTGKIPQSLCKCVYLRILDVAHNSLTGSIPHCFGEFKGMIKERHEDILTSSYDFDVVVFQVMKGIQLEYTKTLKFVYNMDLSSNKLIGQIPLEITTLALLVGLNLSHNHLNGSIPDSIGNMKELNSLDFSDNKFTGMIPPSMAALNFLSAMNLSHNSLSGPIPTGSQLQTFIDPSIYAGNRDLCGAPLPNNCSNHENPPTTESKNKRKDAHKPKNLWFYLDIMCGFATGFWGIIGVLLFKKQWRHKLFMFAEVSMDMIYVAVMVRVSKMKRKRRDAA